VDPRNTPRPSNAYFSNTYHPLNADYKDVYIYIYIYISSADILFYVVSCSSFYEI